MQRNKKIAKQHGFTIVELLIVIVVIAILAAVTIVGYQGISGRANEAAIASKEEQVKRKLDVYKVDKGHYPEDQDEFDTLIGQNPGDTHYTTYTSTPPYDTYTISTSGGGGSGSSNATIVNGDTIQSVTSAKCAALDVYTGSNSDAIRSVIDTRGGTTRTYEIAKLADDNCWMLTNLRVGSTSGSVTLTPDDTNIANNFTLPQLITSGATSYDDPQAIGPVTGDTGSGVTNYGYLYNFPAATAGETRTSLPAGTGNAQYSICPKNWKLPTGRDASGDFAFLNARMNNPSATTGSTSYSASYYQNWQYAGPFKGVYSGFWNGNFSSQGGNVYFWSASASSSAVNSAHGTYFTTSNINPGTNYFNRSYGFGVRCLLR